MLLYYAFNTDGYPAPSKAYVGKTKHTLEYRWSQHESDARRGRQTHFHNALRKRPFARYPLCTASNEDELNQLEQHFIALLGTHDRARGYNSTLGGDGLRATEETRARMSASQNRVRNTPEKVARRVARRKERAAERKEARLSVESRNVYFGMTRLVAGRARRANDVYAGLIKRKSNRKEPLSSQ